MAALAPDAVVAALSVEPTELRAALEPEEAGGLPAGPGLCAWWIEAGAINGVPHLPHPSRAQLSGRSKER